MVLRECNLKRRAVVKEGPEFLFPFSEKNHEKIMIFQKIVCCKNQQHCYIVIGPLRTQTSAQAQWDTPGGDTSKRNAMRYQ